MIASDIMSSPVYVVGLQENVAHARHLMLSHRISRLPVLDGEKLVGIITKKDIAYRLRQSDPIWRRRPIDRIPVHVLMVPDPVSVTPGTSVRDIAALMVARDFSGLPVLDGKNLVGMVTKTDLLRSASVNSLTARAGDLMGEAVTVNRYHSLDHVINLMSERNEPLVVVNTDGTLAGIITDSNLAFYSYSTDSSTGLPEKDVKMLRKGESGGRKRKRYVVEVHAVAEDIMTRPVITIGKEEPVNAAVALMRENGINSVVVVDGANLAGIVNRDNIIREVAK
ncbi:MAG: CBS domain-containing protein [Methanomicrobiales archaeon]|nr:CBS domain-containing protein [Methanomicrobiales archaeon]MDD1662683.1 CBS domain-containing protein [Methanomicrobiales archaeon]